MCIKTINNIRHKMSDTGLTRNLLVTIIEGVLALLAAGAVAYAGMLNSDVERLGDNIYKTEERLKSDIVRLREQVDMISKEQKITIEKLHLEYCGIQRSLADINVAVTALNSRLLSRADVEKIAKREAQIYHQSCENDRRNTSEK